MNTENNQLISIFSRFEIQRPIMGKQEGYNVPTTYFYQDKVIKEYYYRVLRLLK